VPNFVQIGQTVAEIWPFFDFQDGGHPPSWIFKKLEMLTANNPRRAEMRQYSSSKEEMVRAKVREGSPGGRSETMGNWIGETGRF